MKAEYVDHMGTDLSVVNAARVSFDKVSDWEKVDCGHTDCGPECSGYTKRLKDADAKIIYFLAKGFSTNDWDELCGEMVNEVEDLEDTKKLVHKIRSAATHWTPFAHTSITLRMQAPVPIRTQCFKHKQGFVENEESRRYISSRPEFFIPDYFRTAAKNKKQGSGGKMESSDKWMEKYKDHCKQSIDLYMDAISHTYRSSDGKNVYKSTAPLNVDDEIISYGMCPEQARFFLPQGCEVNWIWTGNLYSYANFYNKRTDFHSQIEVQRLALQVGKIIEPLFPVSWKALTQG